MPQVLRKLKLYITNILEPLISCMLVEFNPLKMQPTVHLHPLLDISLQLMSVCLTKIAQLNWINLTILTGILLIED